MARTELSYSMAAQNCGESTFQIGGTVVSSSSGNVSFCDAVEKKIPVYTPATSEAFATYGELDDTACIYQPIEPPKPSQVYEQFGGLQVSTSSTAIASLTDSFIYLRYPFMCNEQIASRIMSIVTLSPVLSAFKNESLPSSEELNETVTRELNELYRNQHVNSIFVRIKC